MANPPKADEKKWKVVIIPSRKDLAKSLIIILYFWLCTENQIIWRSWTFFYYIYIYIFCFHLWQLKPSKITSFWNFFEESLASLYIGEQGWCAFRPFRELWPLPLAYRPRDGSLNSWKGLNTDPSPPIHAWLTVWEYITGSCKYITGWLFIQTYQNGEVSIKK